jgi:protein-S-isoprenylcysteine O-methyltransferase Ste14
MTQTRFWAKSIYAITFLILAPAILWTWAGLTVPFVELPALHSTDLAIALIVAGAFLILVSMAFLYIVGKGLPMNAFPPTHFVHSGPYALFHHPIYIGFVLLMFGVFVLNASASGQWLVTPVLVLCILALVYGYEKIDLENRFPTKDHRVFFDLPPAKMENAGMAERLSSFISLSGILVFSQMVMSFLMNNGLEPFGVSPSLYLELGIILFGVFLLQSKKALRNLSLRIYFGIGWIFLFCLFLPFFQSYTVYLSGHDLEHLSPIFLLILVYTLLLERRIIPIIFALLVIIYFIWQLWLTDDPVIAGLIALLFFLLAVSYRSLWNAMRLLSELIANSWKEWTFGPVRVINHGFYVGMGAFIGIFIAGYIAGPEYALAILVFALVVIVFSALWAQIIEGSEKLKRPYGYYGALVGIIFSSGVLWLMGYRVWPVIGAISVLMPWVQAIGRLRCLINGCCHGSLVDNPELGIRYHHHRSRVCGISGLKGELLHPTPLYSIIWLSLTGIILAFLWSAQSGYAFIFGMYLILTGIGRFVEEAYRGEVQTPIYKGLRLYQWTALISVLIGMAMTCIPTEAPIGHAAFDWPTLWYAIVGGAFTTFAMGIDFPRSNARFSRLV